MAAALLSPFLIAVAQCGGTAEDWLNVLRIKRPWLVLSSADREVDEKRIPRAAARRDAFYMLYRRELMSS